MSKSTFTRKGLSKKTRFEVFKRDKFTCNYCGRKAPDIILYVDHIAPVSKGGVNDLLNLITSCFDCNAGKSNRTLEDSEVIKKQHKQLELLQEKREQQKMMIEWKKSLLKIEEDTADEAIQYLEEKIHPYGLSQNAKLEIKSQIKKYGIEEVLEAISIACTKYLKFDSEEEVNRDSVNFCIQKIGGILYNRALSPIERELSKIKMGASSNLHYFNQKTASIILKTYITALKKYWHYSDEQILHDLENDLAPQLEQKTSWTEWRNLIEHWTEEIERKGTENIREDTIVNESIPEVTPYSEEKVVSDFEDYTKPFLSSELTLNEYLVKPLGEIFQESPKQILSSLIKGFLDEVSNLDKEKLDKIVEEEREAVYTSRYVAGFLEKYEEYTYNNAGNSQIALISPLLSLLHEQLENFLSSYFWFPEGHMTQYMEKTQELILKHLPEILKEST